MPPARLPKLGDVAGGIGRGAISAAKWVGSVLHVLATDPARARAHAAALWVDAKAEARFYWSSTKVLARELSLSAALLRRVGAGDELTRRERMLLKRILGDLVRMLPVLVVVVVPFAELGLPLLIRYNLLPSQFGKEQARQEGYRRSLRTRIELHGILREILADLSARAAAPGDGGAASGGASASELAAQLGALRRGEPLGAAAIVRAAALFKDELTLDTLPRAQLATLAKFIGLSPYAPAALLRRQLARRLAELQADDALLHREGGGATLTRAELKEACEARGMRAVGLAEAAYAAQLDAWLSLSVAHAVPPALLLLSRCFDGAELLPPTAAATEAPAAPRAALSPAPSRGGRHPAPPPPASPAAAEALQSTLAGLDAAAVDEVVLRVAEVQRAGVGGGAPPLPAAAAAEVNALKLAALEHQRAMIAAEAAAGAAEGARLAAAAAARGGTALPPHAAAAVTAAATHPLRAVPVFCRITAAEAVAGAHSAAAAVEARLLDSVAARGSLGAEKLAVEKMEEEAAAAAAVAVPEAAPEVAAPTAAPLTAAAAAPTEAALRSAMARLTREAASIVSAATAGSLQAHLSSRADGAGALTEAELRDAIAVCDGALAGAPAAAAAAALVQKLDVDRTGHVKVHNVVRYLDALQVQAAEKRLEGEKKR